MSKIIEPGLSIYFDLIRFVAALVVLLSHVWPLVFPQFPVPWPGHAAVVVFFVLSGYVIAHAGSKPGLSLGVYASHRAVRILSVTVPALLLSIAIAPVAGGPQIPYAGQMSPASDEFWTAIWLNLFFLGESWSLSVKPPFNPPFWSLCYEVWYYAIFAAWTFAPKRWRPLTAVLTMALAGPKVLVLFPIWLLGVALHHTKVTLGPRLAGFVFVLTLGMSAAFFWFNCSIILRSHLVQLAPGMMESPRGSNEFLGDFILALIVCAHFLAVRSLDIQFARLLRFEKVIRYMASFTLSTYLFHMPLTVLIWNGLNVRSSLAFGVLLGAGVFLLGSVTERQNARVRRLVAKVSYQLSQYFAGGKASAVDSQRPGVK